MPIYGGLGSRKSNTLIILIKYKDTDYDTFDKNLLTSRKKKRKKQTQNKQKKKQAKQKKTTKKQKTKTKQNKTNRSQKP